MTKVTYTRERLRNSGMYFWMNETLNNTMFTYKISEALP